MNTNKNTNPRIDNFIVLDFETGGRSATNNLAIEFAAIWVDSYDFREIDRYSALILPYSDILTIEAEALEANGITIEEIAMQGVELSQVVSNIISKTMNCNKNKSRGKKTVIVGQNASFDISFLQQIFHATKQDLSKIFTGSKDYFGNFQPTYIDTLYLGRTKYATDLDKTSFNLSSLAQYEQIDLVNAHRAMADVESTLSVFMSYVLSMRNNSAESGGVYNIRDNFKFQF